MTQVPLSSVITSASAGYWGCDPGASDVDVAVIRNGDIKTGGVRWESVPTRGLKVSEFTKSQVRTGDILITTSGDCGQIAMITAEPELPTCATNFVRVLRFEPSEVLPRYAFHYLSTGAFRDSLNPFIRGTTLQNLSTRDAFAQAKIPLPSLDEQRRIAAILDQADGLRGKRRQVLAHLDALTQSIFRAMFDGIAAGATVEDVAAPAKGSIRTGPFGSQLLHSEFVDDGIAVLGLDNVVGNEFRWAGRRFITTEKYEQLARYTVHPGDVLISIMGTTGRCVVVPDDIATAINTKHICAITVDRDRLEPIFLRAAFLWHPESREHLRRQTKGSIMDGLNMGIIKAMPVPVPAFDRQREFAARVGSVTARSAAFLRGVLANDELFTCLQSRAFRGDL